MFNFIKNSSKAFKISLFIDIVFYIYILFGLIIFKFIGIIFNIDLTILIYNFIVLFVIISIVKLINNFINKGTEKMVNIINE